MLMYNRDPVEECRRAYKLFDVDDRGMITIEDLRRVMGEIGQTMEEGDGQRRCWVVDGSEIQVCEFTTTYVLPQLPSPSRTGTPGSLSVRWQEK